MERHSKGNAIVIPHLLARSSDKITQYFERFLGQGYEGAMVRTHNGLYKHGRATIKQGTIFKLKSWQDYDGIIVSVHEGKRKKADAPNERNEHGRRKPTYKKEHFEPSGSFGFFTVQVYDDNGPTVTVEIGSWLGITDELRSSIWSNQNDYVGQWCTFQGMAVGVKDKPRIPKNFRLREAKE
jgi:DNA ligase-1